MGDIAGSSRLWNRHAELMSEALATHDRLASASIGDAGGTMFKHTGDGFIAAFDDVSAALNAMTSYQTNLASEAWPPSVDVRSRVCIHHGPAEARDGDYFGATINHLARLTDLVEPTHVVLSSSAVGALTDGLAASSLEPLGAYPVKDVPDPVALFSAPLGTAVGPALSRAAGRGLPQFETAFVGRDEDVAKLAALVEGERLLTIVGFGGMGKTRLAVELASRWSVTHGAPAHLVDLTSAADPMMAVATAIGFPVARLSDGPPPIDAVAKYLGTAPVLLVMDNCEHVIDDAATACDDLRAAVPALTIVATSREPLELDGEAIHNLQMLEPETAVELLQRRAATVGVDEVAADTARQLVDAVDAMPLGIELVVARLRQVPPDELVAALATDLDALRSRRRTRGRGRGSDAAGTTRHATLHSMIEWSYDLLDADEQELLLKLSRFPAPFPRNAPAMIAPHLDPDLVEDLVAKSLVSPVRSQFRMLESVRQFCDTKLAADSAMATDAAGSLVDWALAFAPPVDTVVGLTFDAQTTRTLNEQTANLQAALAAAAELGRIDDEAGLVSGLWQLSTDGSALSWFDAQVASTLERATQSPLREILIRIGLQTHLGDPASSDREVQLVAQLEELDPARELPVWRIVTATAELRNVLINRFIGGDPLPPRTELLRVVSEAGDAGYALDESLSALFLSYSYLVNDDPQLALQSADRSADAGRRCNFPPLVALADASAAMALAFGGDDLAGLTRAESAAPLSEGARWESSVRATRALLNLRLGRVDTARPLVVDLIDFVLEDRNASLIFDAVVTVAALRHAEGNTEATHEALDQLSLPRTPVTTAAMLDLAQQSGFDLGVERFLESLDAAMLAARGVRAGTYLEAVRPDIVAQITTDTA
jgi:predicted ATPase/class 3 adenylate cyclase